MTPIHSLSVSELATVQGARLIDVREAEEFAGPLGRLPGSELVPLGRVPHAAAGWEREQPLILICRSGGRSFVAGQLLAAMGFRRLYNLEGGMEAVNEANLPVERGG